MTGTDLKSVSLRHSDPQRPFSQVEQETLLKGLRIQDHMAEMAIGIAEVREWWLLSEEERTRKSAELRASIEERDAIFRLPKATAIQEIRKRLGCDDHTRPHSYGDRDEKLLIRRIDDLQKKMERDLHRQAREVRAKEHKLEKQINLGIGDIEEAIAMRDLCRRMFGVFRMTYENIAGRKFAG
jgi:hypothetical protein